jgi:putative ABC transport system permease protein
VLYLISEMRIWLKITGESFVLAIKELYATKLRSFLSLFGITIGILCLISVFSAVDSLEKNLRRSIDSLGGDIIYVNKWPWIMTEDYPWWKFVNRPEVSREDFYALQGNMQTAEAMAIWRWVNTGTVAYERDYVENISIFGVSEDYINVRDLEFEAGRYLTEFEFQNAQNKTFIGHALASSLFDNPARAVGKTISFNGVKLEVVGVMKKEGQDVLGINASFGLDNTLYVSDRFADANINSPFSNNPSILVKPRKGISVEETEAELAGKMRIVRKLNPRQEDNFSLNKISVITGVFDQLFSFVYWAGFIIGIFSIVVGAFGIANIMFVSVKERTPIIGIKKALGARKSYILFEFIVEAVLLCLFGGLMGLLLVFGMFQLIDAVALSDSDFKFVISQSNVMLGLGISVVAGLLAGIIPAVTASNMKPVDAIRY